MTITADYHMHSSFSGDSNTPMETMIQQAVAMGLTQICFTEHYDLDYPPSEDIPENFFLADLPAYSNELHRLQEKYRAQIAVGFGIELGLQPHLRQAHTRLVNAYDFDFVIGSSHVCNGQDPYYPAFYKGRSEEEAYREYFQSISDNLHSFHDFDVYGHLDYVVRYGPNKDSAYTYEAYQDLIDPILSLLLELGKGIELNTGGLKYGLREANPCTAVLRRYRELGGELITIGSDAHVPDYIGYQFDRAAAYLKECGFSYYATFQNRVPSYHRLP